MKIILRDDVESLGNFGDLVDVKNGYARNYLIPRGLGVNATAGNLRQLDAEKAAWRKKVSKLKEDADKTAVELSEVSCEFSRKTGEEDGKLFGSVTSMDIENALKEKGYRIERKNILLAQPIKSLGEFTVHVRLHPEVKAGIKVTVVKE